MPNGEENILSVSDLTKQIKITLEEGFDKISVIGEISNFKSHFSGHWYFSLKDENAIINCTMWKGLNSYVFFTPEDGMKVILNGKITVYPPRGNYQIDVRSMKPAGVGELQAAFEKLKLKLQNEGLFDIEHKKPIPKFPKKIGLITAIDGAAIRDMISVAERRYPLVELIVASSKVQGAGAAENIVENIRKLNKIIDIDVILLARGGGSIEDLWSFNEEKVAREIYKSNIPIITGVGHESDFTIADFVSDLRAPTPSVAMELALPDKEEIFVFINDFLYYSEQNISQLITSKRSQVLNVLESYGFRYPIDRVRNLSQSVDSLIYKISQLIEKKYLITKNRISILSKSIDSHSIEKSLKKGFVLVKQNDKFVTRKKKFDENSSSTLKFFDGETVVNKNG